jgi:hypothetical protein
MHTKPEFNNINNIINSFINAAYIASNNNKEDKFNI